MMKVLLVNTYDQRGGAAIATYRVFKGLQKTGITIQLLVQEKLSDETDIIGPPNLFSAWTSALRPYLDFFIPFLSLRKRKPFFPAILPGNIISKINRLDPDIVHLNWITGGFIKLESLAGINRPLIWTLHDMWAFTGGCHYTEGCHRYENSCGKCPVLNSSRERDLSSWIFNRKKETYSRIKNLTITTPSHWLADSVRKSELLKGFSTEVIPNGLDTTVFSPLEKISARKELSLDPEKKLILFGAIDATQNKLKGFKYLKEAIKKLSGDQIELMVFGDSRSSVTDYYGLKVNSFGYIDDNYKLRCLYSAADVMVVPSIQEVFGQTATEAMSCGTPVVAFRTTGLLDIIDHKQTGYLASLFDAEDLAKGIRWCIEDQQRNLLLSENARKKVLDKFDINKIAEMYKDLYHKILSNS